MWLNKKGMEAWVIIFMIIALLVLIVVIIIMSKASSETGNIFDKIFELFRK